MTRATLSITTRFLSLSAVSLAVFAGATAAGQNQNWPAQTMTPSSATYTQPQHVSTTSAQRYLGSWQGRASWTTPTGNYVEFPAGLTIREQGGTIVAEYTAEVPFTDDRNPSAKLTAQFRGSFHGQIRHEMFEGQMLEHLFLESSGLTLTVSQTGEQVGPFEVALFAAIGQDGSLLVTLGNEEIRWQEMALRQGGASFGPANGPTTPNYGPANGPGMPNYGPANGPGVPTNYGPTNGPSMPNYGPTNGPGVPNYGPTNGPAIPNYGPANGPSVPNFGPTTGPTMPNYGPTNTQSSFDYSGSWSGQAIDIGADGQPISYPVSLETRRNADGSYTGQYTARATFPHPQTGQSITLCVHESFQGRVEDGFLVLSNPSMRLTDGSTGQVVAQYPVTLYLQMSAEGLSGVAGNEQVGFSQVNLRNQRPVSATPAFGPGSPSDSRAYTPAVPQYQTAPSSPGYTSMPQWNQGSRFPGQ